MKKSIALPLLLSGILVLAACGPQSNPTPAGSLPPVEAPTDASQPPSGPTVEVSIQDFTFQPVELTVAVGTTVVWTNLDSAPHTVTADDDSWGSGQLAKNGQFSFTFTEAGTFPYHCGNHASMAGTVVVTP